MRDTRDRDDGRSSTILAVDDEPINIEVYRLLFEDGYDMRFARSGEEAIAMARECQPDLILLDVMMPGMSGYDVCRKLREDATLRFAKIMLVSARATAEERLDGYEAGADDYVTKPFCHEELIAKVDVFLKLKSVEQLDNLKSGILSVLAHETRTPLQHIVGAAEMMRVSGGDLSKSEIIDWSDMIMSASERLLRLIERGTLLAEFRNGQVEQVIRSTDVSLIVAAAVENHRGAAAEKGVEIRLTSPDRLELDCDREHFSFIPDALLDNAIKFQSPGLPIDVVLDDAEGQVTLTVSDQGAGMDAAFLPSLFEGFLVQDVRHHTTGNGLSLALCDSIVRKLGGCIDVTSSPGEGASFVVSIPTAGRDSSCASIDSVSRS